MQAIPSAIAVHTVTFTVTQNSNDLQNTKIDYFFLKDKEIK
jgi:hypothetical protein